MVALVLEEGAGEGADVGIVVDHEDGVGCGGEMGLGFWAHLHLFG